MWEVCARRSKRQAKWAKKDVPWEFKPTKKRSTDFIQRSHCQSGAETEEGRQSHQSKWGEEAKKVVQNKQNATVSTTKNWRNLEQTSPPINQPESTEHSPLHDVSSRTATREKRTRRQRNHTFRRLAHPSLQWQVNVNKKASLRIKMNTNRQSNWNDDATNESKGTKRT